MRARWLLTLAIAAMTACQSSRVYREGHVASGNQQVSFLSSEVVPEKKVVVIIGECLSRKLSSLREQEDRSSGQQVTDGSRDALIREDLDERKRAIHYRILVQSLVLRDDAVVPNPNMGYTASVEFKTTARFVALRIEFPDDGDQRESIVDANRGPIVLFSRDGEWIDMIQTTTLPSFE